MAVPSGDWADVDGAEDPASFVRWLDVSRHSQAKLAESDPEGFFAYLHVCPGDRILEVGCGMIGEAQRRTSDASLPLDFQIGTAYRLDFDGSPDAALGEQILHVLEAAMEAKVQPHGACDDLAGGNR